MPSHSRRITDLDVIPPNDGDIDRGTIEHPLFGGGGRRSSPKKGSPDRRGADDVVVVVGGGRNGRRKRERRHNIIDMTTTTTATAATSTARWKVLSVVVLSILILVLSYVNYLLLGELDPGGGIGTIGATAPGGWTTREYDDGDPSSAGDTENGTEREMARLVTLRRKVEETREDVRAMRGMVEKIRSGRGRGGLDDDGTDGGEFPRLTCTPDVARRQADRLNERFREWWSHSACPDQAWMGGMIEVFRSGSTTTTMPYLMLDVGCNKGYASADFLDALSPGSGINPSSLVDAIRSVSRETKTRIDRDGGVCNDSKRRLNPDRTTERMVQVHCFEPSPATYNMLKLARSKLIHADGGVAGGGGAMWNIHNLGLHSEVGDMMWHPACANAVGDELCTIVPDGTMEGAITVPVVTVDRFLKDAYSKAAGGGEGRVVVHLLKIDAEGLDPAVLGGSTNLLTRSGAILVTFEFNPRLSEKKENPHGMWGKGGNPRKDLLEVTSWLDGLGYDCYVDSRRVDNGERDKGVPDAPALYRITGNCLTEEPRVRGWANVVCASRKFKKAASMLRNLATMV
ncbi:hypothetical protein ACHAXA_000228 [Cyclostephanos tholiformis]|uniref:Methyltransferase FkbM domain-containing protein n=1 Tax=Cyclostephanos tholiformis TaxID=382380 RepID=A0ABD3RA16_9STRA